MSSFVRFSKRPKQKESYQSQNIKELFDLIDLSGTGNIGYREIIKTMRTYAFDQKHPETFLKINQFYKEGKGVDKTSYAEFKQLFSGGFITQDPDEELKTIFDLIDQEGKGYISAADLQVVFTENLDELDEEYFKGLEKILDENGNENLDFDDFKTVLRQSVLRDTPFDE